MINTNKSDLGKVSKQVLESIKETLRVKLGYNQWRKTADVLEWLKNVENKERATFIQFDIDNYYPSITAELLEKALTWAKLYVEVSEQDIEIIMSTKQNILYNKGQPWVKRAENPIDVTMGSWDGAEVSDLVGLFLLSQIKDLNLNSGLYRDDGLGATTKRPQQVENTKKKICQIFRENGLKITIEANKKSVYFYMSLRPYQKHK